MSSGRGGVDGLSDRNERDFSTTYYGNWGTDHGFQKKGEETVVCPPFPIVSA
jgi:hypothetical protein